MFLAENNRFYEPIKISLSNFMRACFSEYTVTSQMKRRLQTMIFNLFERTKKI